MLRRRKCGAYDEVHGADIAYPDKQASIDNPSEA